jgi:multidrug resistance efflux pump
VRKLLLVLGAIFAVFLLKPSRQYCPARAYLYAPMREIKAEVDGVILDAILREGDHFQRGTSLFALDGAASERMKEIDAELTVLTHALEQAILNAEQVKDQFASVKVALDDGPSELVAEMQAGIRENEEKVSNLESQITAFKTERDHLPVSREMATAPFDGMVLERLLGSGEAAKAGDSILLICSHDLSIEAEVPETMFSKISLDQSATVRLPSFPGKKWDAVISWISPTAKEGKLKIRLTAQELPFKPGLTAEVAILL